MGLLDFCRGRPKMDFEEILEAAEVFEKFAKKLDPKEKVPARNSKKLKGKAKKTKKTNKR